MDRKDWLIKQAQASIVKHNQNLDYQTKVLYNEVRAVTKRLSPEELALVLVKVSQQ